MRRVVGDSRFSSHAHDLRQAETRLTGTRVAKERYGRGSARDAQFVEQMLEMRAHSQRADPEMLRLGPELNRPVVRVEQDCRDLRAGAFPFAMLKRAGEKFDLFDMAIGTREVRTQQIQHLSVPPTEVSLVPGESEADQLGSWSEELERELILVVQLAVDMLAEREGVIVAHREEIGELEGPSVARGYISDSGPRGPGSRFLSDPCKRPGRDPLWILGCELYRRKGRNGLDRRSHLRAKVHVPGECPRRRFGVGDVDRDLRLWRTERPDDYPSGHRRGWRGRFRSGVRGGGERAADGGRRRVLQRFPKADR